MSETKTTVGSVEVILYAGLRGADPIEVGTLRVPLTLRKASAGTIEGHLSEALEYVSEDFRAVFGREPEPCPVTGDDPCAYHPDGGDHPQVQR